MKAKIRKEPPRKITKLASNAKRNELNSKKLVLPGLEWLVNTVCKTVISQDDVVKSVCTKVYEGILFPELKSNILIVGKSGTGKTEIIRQIASHIGVPFTIEDCSELTESGYIGSSVDDIIKNLIRVANNNIYAAQNGIVFLDEIDKKIANINPDSTAFVNKEGVLKELLKMIEGKKIFVDMPSKFAYEMPQKVEFDTSNIIFIMGGAFSGLEKIREKRLKKGIQLGFSVSDDKKTENPQVYLKTSFSKADLREFGMPEEFLGRIGNIYETKTLDSADLEKILKISQKSPFKTYENTLQYFGKKMIYPKNIYEKIANQAQSVSKSSTGARELTSVTSYMFEKIIYDLLTKDLSQYNECIIKKTLVSDNTQYIWR